MSTFISKDRERFELSRSSDSLDDEQPRVDEFVSVALHSIDQTGRVQHLSLVKLDHYADRVQSVGHEALLFITGLHIAEDLLRLV